LRIGLVAAPFIPVPPVRYGGTELFVGQLAHGLTRLGHDVVVYANGESNVPCELRYLYPSAHWPPESDLAGLLRDINHTGWACRDANKRVDVIHLNSAPGLSFTRFLDIPTVYTVHHPKEPILSEFYARMPDVSYVTISAFQQSMEAMPRMTTIHHGLDTSLYRLTEKKQAYLSFLGRMTPQKAPHLAVEVARKAGIPLKLAGEIQPMYRGYWESKMEPLIDGSFVEFLGEADLQLKNELLGNSMALLFPIQWDEPFGLVMIEAMACGTPVIALPGGSVREVVADGVSGWVCRDADEMVSRVLDLHISATSCRQYVEDEFSIELMVRRYESVYEDAIETAGVSTAGVSGDLGVVARRASTKDETPSARLLSN
jgi:glycosyltransferase involved in cell wall biosynthesis